MNLLPPPELEKPRGQRVHLWNCSLDLEESKVDSAIKFLSADELQRAARFRFPLHRVRFVAGRGLLRSILGRYLDCDPAGIEFMYSAFGKPHLKESDLYFNLAHSEDRFILAICEKPVGVDIELRRSISDLDSLADHVFSPAELARWKTRRTTDSFLSLWTRKEAVLKAIGLGVANHVKEVNVFFDDEDVPVVPAALTLESWSARTCLAEDEIWSVAVPFAAPEIVTFSPASQPATAFRSSRCQPSESVSGA